MQKFVGNGGKNSPFDSGDMDIRLNALLAWINKKKTRCAISSAQN